MKTFSLIAASALGMGLALPALAEPIDLGAATCGEVSALDPETISVILMWMDGYTGGLMGDSTFDSERLKANVDAASAACEANPDRSLLDAMKEAVGG